MCIILHCITFIQLTAYKNVNSHLLRVAMASWLVYRRCKAKGRGFETCHGCFCFLFKMSLKLIVSLFTHLLSTFSWFDKKKLKGENPLIVSWTVSLLFINSLFFSFLQEQRFYLNIFSLCNWTLKVMAPNHFITRRTLLLPLVYEVIVIATPLKP